MMSATFERSGSNLKPVFRCEVCGEYASFGQGVNLSLAIDRKDAKLAGRWFCAKHNDPDGQFMSTRHSKDEAA